MDFKLVSKNKPAGDQPKAIKELVSGLKKGYDHQTLLGVTGSGKTFTVANVIARIQKPTLVIAHNKTLAAQLCNEFRELFPENAVQYFVSYYDYYQPEAYLPTTDTYIGKEALINDEIDKLRHAATTSLLTRKDVIVVASVSCIYGLGAPEVYSANILNFKVGDTFDRKELMRKLVKMQFKRTTADLKRGTFRLRGDNWEIMPPYEEVIYNFLIEKNRIIKIFLINPVSGRPAGGTATAAMGRSATNGVNPVKGFELGKTPSVEEVFISPARHFISHGQDDALKEIKEELKVRLKYFEENGKYLEAERLERRVKNDLAMIREIGYCHGIENYSRHLSGRREGEPPATLLNYFPHSKISGQADFLTVIDESHATVPQLNGMYAGDASRKKTLVEYGFRLPSAIDNRPLKFSEFQERVGQVIYTSATPSPYELEKSRAVVKQIVRPTGLVDPRVVIRPAKGQVDDLIPRVEERVNPPAGGVKERVLITTLTKRMAEDLSEYLNEKKFKVAYLHSDVKTLERIKILTNLRKGNFDVLVGVNLLREGLDLPEVSLVAILDADKEGFLRSETSLIQTIGRAARNVKGEVLIYADQITGSIKRAVRETETRRRIQLAHNKKHGITPTTIIRAITDIMPVEEILNLEARPIPKSKTALKLFIRDKEREMKRAAEHLDFELAAILRDEIKSLSKTL